MAQVARGTVKKQALDLLSVLLAMAALGAAAVVVYDTTRVERTYASAMT